MASFKSSAGSVGFDPITQPDNARRVREENDRRIRNLRDVYQADINNKRNYVQNVEAADAKTMQNIRQNQNLQREFDKVYEEQLNKRYKQEVANAEKRAKAERSPLDRLSQFSQTAAQIGGELVKKQREDDQEFGLLLASQYSLSPDDLVALKSGEAELEAESTAANRVLNRLRASGATPDQIQAIRDLDGYRLYGAEQHFAQQGGELWNQWLNNDDNRRAMVDVDGQGTMMSLEMAQQRGLGAEYRTIRGIHKAKFLKNYRHLSREFASEYLYPKINKVDAIDDSGFNTTNNERLEKEQNDERMLELMNIGDKLAKDPKAYSSSLIRRSGGDPAQMKYTRAEDMETILEGVKNGQITASTWNAIKESQVDTGSGKPKSFYDQFINHPDTGAFIRQIDDALAEKQKDDYTKRKQAIQLNAQKMDEDFVRNNSGRKVSPEELNTYYTIRRKQYPTVPLSSTVQKLINNDGSDPLDITLQQEIIEDRILDGSITEADLDNPKFNAISDEKRAEYIKLIRGETGIDMKDSNAEKVISAALKESLFGTAATKDMVSTEIELMKPKAFQYYKSLVRQIMSKEKIGYADAVPLALFEVEKSIKARESFFALNKDASGNDIIGEGSGFAQNKVPPEVRKTDDFLAIQKQVRDNPNLFSEKPVFGTIDDPNSFISEIDQEVRFSKTAPKWLRDFGRQTPGMTWKDIANRQLIMQDLPPLAYARDELIPQVVAPEVRSLTTDQPTLGGTTRALKYTAQRQGEQGMAIYTPMLDLMASKESSNDEVHNGYDALNRGGTDGGHSAIGTSTGLEQFGKPLIEMTYDEVRALQNSGSLHAVGRYQFIGKTLRDMEERGLLDPRITGDTLFNEEVQDRIAISYLNDTIGTYRGTDGNIIYGLGQRWIGLQKVDRAKVQRALDIIQGDIRLEPFQGVDFRSDFLQGGGAERVLAYITDNIGPTSTGDHLDVKQVGGQRFAEDELDQYVEVDDPEFGTVGLGEIRRLTGGIGDDFDEHQARGSHGIDYGLYRGTEVYVKNGAKVVGSTPSEHGDVVTIELPDGRQFTFLHGKQA